MSNILTQKRFKAINFVNPDNNNAYQTVVQCALIGFEFPKVHDMLISQGYRITEKQYVAIKTVMDEQLNLDVGKNQEYLYKNDGHLEVGLQNEVLRFIELVRESFVQAEFAYLNGSCGHFSKILCNRFSGVSLVNKKGDHVVTCIGGNLYDITGLVPDSGEHYRRLKSSEMLSDPKRKFDFRDSFKLEWFQPYEVKDYATKSLNRWCSYINKKLREVKDV